MSIYIIKLISGIELITEVSLQNENVDILDQTLHLERPLRFGNAGNNSEGRPQIGFFPYLIAEPEPDRVKLNGKMIESYLIEAEIDEPLVKEYKTRTSRIQLI